MPDPAPTSSPTPTPAPAATEGFDPYEFWILHKTRIIAFAGLLAVALGGYGLFSLQQTRARSAAEAAFAKAKTTEDFRKVASEHAGQPASGNAQLHLAALLRNEGKLDEANTTLRAFIEQNPQHPMLAGAWLALAENAEAAGKVDDGLIGYQKVLTTFPTSFATPLALLGQARLQKTKGQNDLAKRSYEQIIAQYQGTPFHMEAQRELHALNKTTP
jgi:TolA-binding protein